MHIAHRTKIFMYHAGWNEIYFLFSIFLAYKLRIYFQKYVPETGMAEIFSNIICDTHGNTWQHKATISHTMCI